VIVLRRTDIAAAASHGSTLPISSNTLTRGAIMTAPLSPDDVAAAKLATIPDAVIAVFNRLIAESMGADGRATVTLEAAKEAVAAAGVDVREAFARGWFDIEPVYRAAGWGVVFDKPGFNESYEAFYVFAKRR
jgi:hypothetical protein